ncbi:NAD(P)/FAD-dependent oxidoreductase [Mucilaginibacter antarcticus]|uniref:NAD(P)/FAD-dependent oxidoreductase n=1 Tax=Mucilaginibacter antarcticus TaxID=1855725 RepID=A0ABW5XU33_9SPHI
MNNIKKAEVIIIGGSYAGLSAAMALGRSLRTVLIIDSGLPCNRQTPQSHNFITHDGSAPAEIARQAKAQVLKYPTITFVTDLVITGRETGNGFEVITQSGQSYEGQKLIFATGIADQMPDITGFAACWGITAIHCPYCHGFEFKQQETAIMANGERAIHLAGLINNLTPNLSIITSGTSEFNDEQWQKLRDHSITVIEKPVKEVVHTKGQISRVIFADGSTIKVTALYAALPFKQHTDIPETLGCELTEQGYIKIDQFQKTTVKGIFACGDNSAMMRSVANAVYTGNLTGAIVNKELVDDSF